MTDLPYPGLTDRHLLTHRARRNATSAEIPLLRLLLAPSSQLTAADLVLQRAVRRR